MSPKNDADLERFETSLDLNSEGAGLKARLEHYEGHLKNGSQDDRKAIARGVSALLAASVETSKKLDEMATRAEVRGMISSHATTCALARPPQTTEEISIWGSKFSGKGKAAVATIKWLGFAAGALLIMSLPYLAGLITAWKGGAAKAEAAAVKAEAAVEVAGENQDQAQRDRDAMMAMMQKVLQEVRSEAQK